MSTVTLYAIRETYNQDTEAYDQFAKALKKGGGELLQGSVTKAADKAGIGSARPVFYLTADEAKLDDPKTKVRFEVISQRAFDKKFGVSSGYLGGGYTSVDISEFEHTTSKTQKAGEQRFSAATQRAEKTERPTAVRQAEPLRISKEAAKRNELQLHETTMESLSMRVGLLNAKLEAHNQKPAWVRFFSFGAKNKLVKELKLALAHLNSHELSSKGFGSTATREALQGHLKEAINILDKAGQLSPEEKSELNTHRLQILKTLIQDHSHSVKGSPAEKLAEQKLQCVRLRQELIQIHEELAAECSTLSASLPSLKDLQAKLKQHEAHPTSKASQDAYNRVLKKQSLREQRLAIARQLAPYYEQQIKDLESLIADKSKFLHGQKPELSGQLNGARARLEQAQKATKKAPSAALSQTPSHRSSTSGKSKKA